MKTLVIVLLLAFTVPAAAQQQQQVPPVGDIPIGAPFRTGVVDSSAVPLRDFLSRDIENLTTWILRLFDERDRQYTTRFEGLASRAMFELVAAKDALVLARDERKEATIKAEQATAQHFSSINGLNDRLEEQARDFATAESQAALEKAFTSRFEQQRDAITRNEQRLTELTARGTGAGELLNWVGWLVAGAVGVTGLITFFRNQQQQRPAPVRRRSTTR